mgnify:FL=1
MTALAITPLAPTIVRAAENDATSESTTSIQFIGQLIELSSTEAPTTIIVRDVNEGGEGWVDYTVDIDTETVFGTWTGNTTVMSDWITGDWLSVKGIQNENTAVVTADVVINQSLNPTKEHGVNGWITAIDLTASTMTVQYDGVETVIRVTGNTHMVIPPMNPAALSDFLVGDRIRARLVSGTDDEARIIVALRRGDEIFLKARTRAFYAELNDIQVNEDGSGIMTVTLVANPHLREGDVNNLIGTEGEERTVIFSADETTFVRKFNGETTPDEFSAGDSLMIVGRVNDDNTISARLVKDADIWRTNASQRFGEVTAIDTSTNTITLSGRSGHGGNTLETTAFLGLRDRSGDEGQTVTVTYSDSTTFTKDGETVSETTVVVGDRIRVRGTATISSSGTLSITSVDSIWIKGDLDETIEVTEDVIEEDEEEDSDTDTEDTSETEDTVEDEETEDVAEDAVEDVAEDAVEDEETENATEDVAEDETEEASTETEDAVEDSTDTEESTEDASDEVATDATV